MSDSDGSETEKQRPKRVYPLRSRNNSTDTPDGPGYASTTSKPLLFNEGQERSHPWCFIVWLTIVKKTEKHSSFITALNGENVFKMLKINSKFDLLTGLTMTVEVI